MSTNFLLAWFVLFTLFKFNKCNIESEGAKNPSGHQKSLSNGLGESYEWHGLEDGLSVSRREGKPLMVILHKTHCGACKAFKSKFSESEVTLKLSTNLVMVNIPVDEVTASDKFSVDGKYVPRVFFLDMGGNVHSEIYNKNGNPDYKYFYYDMKDVINSMQVAISSLGSARAKEL